MKTETLKLSLKLKSQPVELGSDKYTLEEMTGALRDGYMQDNQARFELDKDGKTSRLKDWKGLQASLICRCLKNSKGELVEEDVADSFPASVQTALFDACQTLNGLDVKPEDAEEKAGND